MPSSKAALITALFLAQLLAETTTSSAGDVALGSRQGAPDGKQLDQATRESILRNRQQLLGYLGDRAKRAVICTPALDESYDLSQASIHEELDVLWDLDIYASRYGLTKKQHNAVKACSSALEKYLDNFELWQQVKRKPE